LEPELSLEQNGKIHAAARGQLLVEQYPTSNWQSGEIVRERRMVEIPVWAAPGVATLSLRLGERSEWLGEVEIGSVERLEALPRDVQPVNASFGELARFAGYSLPQSTFHTGEDVAITLYWQAIRSGGDDYTVFVHILNTDGRLIGQHDGVPADGRRPTGGWVEGEYIADTHLVVFRDPAYSGPATIEVGLYDPQTGQRLELADGSDAFRLPAPLTIQRSSD
jgi:hypothetical protein